MANDNALQVLTDVERRLAAVTTVDGAKAIRDQAEAFRVYAKSARKGLDVQNRAATIKLLAERRAGELLALIQRGRGSKVRATLARTYKENEIAARTGDRWQTLATIPEAEIKRREAQCNDARTELTSAALYTERTRQTKEQEREARRDVNREKVRTVDDPTLGGAKFATIAIDPPWDWGDEGDVDQLGRARPIYATKTFDEVRAHPVAALADVDCHLYLWITNRSLPKGFDLLDAWGFRYVTCLTWCKPSIGMGNYFRGSTEQILFGVKGSQPLKRRDVGTWFAAPREGAHSTKPTAFYELVESCSPSPYLDIFGRSVRDGWTVWGEGTV